MRRTLSFILAILVVMTLQSRGQEKRPLVLAVGMFQPTAELNMSTYQPLARYLSEKLGRSVELKVIEGWAGFVPAFKSGTLDLALMGPWGYVMAHEYAGAQAIATIEYDGRPTYHAIAVTNRDGIHSVLDGKGKTYAFADVGSTSGYLIPRYIMKTMWKIDPDTYFGKVVNLPHATIEKQVAARDVDLGSDYDRNRDLMIEKGLIKAEESRVIWTSDPLPNDAFAVSREIAADGPLTKKLQDALLEIKQELKKNPGILPNHYTGFVKADRSTYEMIRNAGIQSGALTPTEGHNAK